jgi:hypothetical protein
MVIIVMTTMMKLINDDENIDKDDYEERDNVHDDSLQSSHNRRAPDMLLAEDVRARNVRMWDVRMTPPFKFLPRKYNNPRK